jgi:cellulose synthase/poly-beta-1,6-N-acetylglucosamine synthase-like glycosyltransferase
MADDKADFTPCALSEATPLNDSLSIVVPVRNAERSLASQIGKLLDVLPDLTSRFEVLVVDDGSTDQTIDAVRELAARYPQVRLIRHREPRGIEAAVRTGLQWAQGATVFVQEDAASLSAAQLRELWSLRNDDEVVMARSAARPGVFDPQLLERLCQWGRTLQSAAQAKSGGIHMICRAAVEKLLADGDTGDEPMVTHLAAGSAARTDASHSALPPPRSGSFLRHLKQLALGE